MLRSRVRHYRLRLQETEAKSLETPVEHAGNVLTHRQLIVSVRGVNYESETHLLQVNICNLWRKIELEPTRPTDILTEPGVGYRLKMV